MKTRISSPTLFVRTLTWLLTASIVSTSFPTVSFGSFARTVAWKEMAQLDEKTISRTLYSSPLNLYVPGTVSDEVVDLVLADSEKRIHKNFHIPKQLKSTVAFWFRIYSQYSTQQVVLFDSEQMEMVYEVVDLRPLAESSASQAEFMENSSRLVRETMDKYQEAFISLAKNSKPKNPSREEQLVLASMKRLKHRPSFADMAENIKMVRGQRDSMIKGLLAAETFLPKMELIFSRMNIPVELTRLSLVESSFNFRALSKVGALGVWQFMPYSGKEYLLIDANKRIDERLSPLKATLAAGKLLLANFNALGNWPLAIIAYNHGTKNLPRMAGEEYDFSKIADLFEVSSEDDEAPALGFASRNYFSEFLAAVYAEAYRDHLYGQTPSPSIRSVDFQQLTKKQSALDIAFERGISIQEFQFYNSDIQDIHRPLPKGFWYAIPGETDNIAGLIEHVLSNS